MSDRVQTNLEKAILSSRGQQTMYMEFESFKIKLHSQLLYGGE